MQAHPSKNDNNSEEDHDIYTDPALKESSLDDPAITFIKTNWKSVLVIALAVVSVVYARDALQKNFDQKTKNAADIYGRLRTEYVSLSGMQQSLSTLAKDDKEYESKKLELEKNIESARTKTNELVRALSDEDAPYHDIAQLYAGLMIAPKDLQKLVEHAHANDWSSLGTSESGRMERELLSLRTGRLLVDSEERREEGIAVLTKLAREGAYVHTSAGIALARIAKSSEEKEAAKEVLQALMKNHPEQAGTIESELKNIS